MTYLAQVWLYIEATSPEQAKLEINRVLGGGLEPNDSYDIDSVEPWEPEG